MKAHRVDNHSYQIMEGERVVGFAIKNMGGTWGAYDESDERLTPEQFETPDAVCRWFETGRTLQ